MLMTFVGPEDPYSFDCDSQELFIKIKQSALGYAGASVRTPSQGNPLNIALAGYGAVKHDEDGQMLIAALHGTFPNITFVIFTVDKPGATDFVWHV